jgi:hypothetical protein
VARRKAHKHIAKRSERKHLERVEEEERQHPPGPHNVDPKYLEHHDAATIMKTQRDEEMHPLEFPT